MASYIDGLGLAAVVGVAPSSVVWQALADGRPPDKPRWTLRGRPLNYAPVRGERVLWQIMVKNPLRTAVRRPPELHAAKACEAGLRQPAATDAAIPVERIRVPRPLARTSTLPRREIGGSPVFGSVAEALVGVNALVHLVVKENVLTAIGRGVAVLIASSRLRGDDYAEIDAAA
jgi:hypothetical protein